MSGGRPRLYEDAKSFEDAVEVYFASCEVEEKRPTLSGLSYAMGFSDRESFVGYEDYGDEFSRTVKMTRLRIEDDRWQQLLNKDKFTPGVIFDLKNNHGWKDKVHNEHTGKNGEPIQMEMKPSDRLKELLNAKSG